MARETGGVVEVAVGGGCTGGCVVGMGMDTDMGSVGKGGGSMEDKLGGADSRDFVVVDMADSLCWWWTMGRSIAVVMLGMCIGLYGVVVAW